MVRAHSHRRFARLGAVIGAATLLAALCAPAALLAQSPDLQSPDPSTVPDPPAETPAPEAPTPPAPSEPSEPSGDEPATGDPYGPVDPTGPQPGPLPAPEPDPTGTPAASAGGTTVTMADFSFSPATVTVSEGDSVTWTNSGPDEPHTATGDGFDTGQVAVGSSGSATFSQAGTFPYVCTLHPEMTGTVRVLAAASGAGDEAAGGATADAPAPGSEAAAVAAPDAAGTASKLPASGFVALPLVVVGLALLLAGTGLRRQQGPSEHASGPRNPNNRG
jgi:plastocyanin